MGGILQEINIGAAEFWTLFDPETRNSYITSDPGAGQFRQTLRTSRRILLRGMVRDVKEACLVMAAIEGHSLEFQADVVDHIGRDANDWEIDVVVGSLALKLWNIKLDMANERLDFANYSRTFVEFSRDFANAA